MTSSCPDKAWEAKKVFKTLWACFNNIWHGPWFPNWIILELKISGNENGGVASQCLIEMTTERKLKYIVMFCHVQINSSWHCFLRWDERVITLSFINAHHLFNFGKPISASQTTHRQSLLNSRHSCKLWSVRDPNDITLSSSVCLDLDDPDWCQGISLNLLTKLLVTFYPVKMINYYFRKYGQLIVKDDFKNEVWK